MAQTTGNGIQSENDALHRLSCDPNLNADTFRLAIYSHSRRAQMEWKSQQRGINMIALIETELQSTFDQKSPQKQHFPSCGSCLQDVIREENAAYAALGEPSLGVKISPCAYALSDVVNRPHALHPMQPHNLRRDGKRSRSQEPYSHIRPVPRIEITAVDMKPKETDVVDLSDENKNLERRQQLLRILRRSK